MEGIFGALVVLLILVYLFNRSTASTSKNTTSIKLRLQPPKTSTHSNPLPQEEKKSSVAVPPLSSKNTFTTTGEFTKSTEGFIPTDKCECGGNWVKHVNKSSGGRFFGCSNFPRCDNTRDRQQAKKYCSNGHARTSQNTAYNSDGSRRCLVCKPIIEKPQKTNSKYSNFESDTKNSDSDSTNEFCRNGHERTNENTYERPDGKRECRICRRNAR